MFDKYTFIYIALFLIIWGTYLAKRQRTQRHAYRELKQARDAGLMQPASLHPVIDATACIGCRSCISACPEKNVLGLIRDKAELINPSHCIGHGACKTACPMDAITLVFGTAERGVDIPLVSPDFETNVAGIYIAGELGGMGLIRNATEQGRQAMESIIRSGRKSPGGYLDVVIIGSGPAGIAATLAAHESKLDYVAVDQDSLGGTVAHFPRGKLVMTAPIKLPIVGKMNFREVSKEELLEFWQDVIVKTGIKINYGERVDTIDGIEDGFIVKTSSNEYRTSSVLLAIGRRGTPRTLGVPGEESNKVVYRLIDPEQYRNQHVLVVGGGDSALEAAASIAELPDTTVTISYRSESFSRAKEKNRQRIASLGETGNLKILMSSNVKAICDKTVKIEQQGNILELDNDAVIICAGGVLPTPFLKNTGIEVETKYGTA
ncbi:MAG: NAD(P)-binding domain-containing protein [Gammaproteobacteria bacterium]|nr:NAD(P)-binding domain-containing protein [Gammaproteobacteria bacterium]MDH5513539.1 NAD(P)-binding domain-containing protein [Gammaproteobacteria bacterium]